MMEQNVPRILLTNDDGIDASGLEAVYERLTDIGDVTTVAPATDNSGIGRVLSMGRSTPLTFGDGTDSIEFGPPEYSWEVPFRSHELGYEVVGTPADCVVAGVSALDIDPDVVVSGCNPGPNVGLSVFGRSGTVSAAAEAAHRGVPGIAVSSTNVELDRGDFAVESDFVSQLVQFALRTDLFDDVDYLNTLVPSSVPDRVVIAEPSDSNNITADIDPSENCFRFSHTYFEQLRNGNGVDHRVGTDRHAVGQNEASISPLTLREGPVESASLERFGEEYEPDVTRSPN